jgi:hypothetical protein
MSVVECPNCHTQFQALRHAPRGSGASYVVEKLNDVHLGALKALHMATGALELREVALRVNNERTKIGLPIVARNGVGGRLSEMQNSEWALTECWSYGGKPVWQLTPKGRQFVEGLR